MVMYKNTGYVISEEGQVYSKAGDLMSFQIKNGYAYYELYIDGCVKRISGHSIIAECYLGERPMGMVINHKDGNKLNNRVSNLEYITPAENTKHAHDTGLIKKGAGRPRLKPETISSIKEYRSKGYSKKEISVILNISEASVSKVKDFEKGEEYFIGIKDRVSKNCLKNNRFTKVIQESVDGVFIKEWDSANGAAKSLGIDAGSIWQNIRGKRKRAGGFVWRKKESADLRE